MSPPSPAGRGSVGPAGMGACSRRCSPPPKMPLHLPGPPQTKLQDFARHPRLSPAVPWVLFPPVPVRCRPLPPYGHAGFRPWAPPHALLSAGGGGGWGAPGSPFSLRGLRFWLQATLPDFAPGSSHGEFPWRGEEAERCGQAPPPRHVFPPRRPLPHAPRGSWGFGADSIPARFGTYVLQAAPNHGASVQLTWRLHQTHLHGVSG